MRVWCTQGSATLRACDGSAFLISRPLLACVRVPILRMQRAKDRFWFSPADGEEGRADKQERVRVVKGVRSGARRVCMPYAHR